MKGIYCFACKRKRDGNKCSCGEKRVFIQFNHEGKTYQIFRDTNGNPLFYSDSEKLKKEIDYDRLHKTFEIRKYIKTGERTFEGAFQAFLDQKEKRLHPSTIYLYKTYLRRYFEGLGSIDVRTIKLKHLQEWYDSLKGLSAKYKKNMVDCLKTFFNWLKRWGEIDEIPIMPEIEHADSMPRIAVSVGEQIEMLNRIPEIHRDIYEFLMETGLRPGEAAALKVSDCDLKSGSILVQRTDSRNQLIETTKGKHKTRIPLSDRAVELVHRNIGIDTTAFLFLNPVTHRGYSTEFLRKTWRHYISECDLYSATRHSFCTQLVEVGVSPMEAQELMRHKDGRSTKQYYHPTMERQRGHLNQRKVIPIR